MNPSLSNFLLSVAGAMRVFSCLTLISYLPGASKNENTRPVLHRTAPVIFAFAALLLRFFLSLPAQTHSEALLIAAEILCILSGATLIRKRELRISLFFAFFGEMAFVVWNALVSYGAGSFLKDDRFLSTGTLQGCLAALFPALPAFSFSLFLLIRKQSAPRHAYRIFTALLILTMFATIYLQNLEPFHPDDEQYTNYVFFSALLLLSLLIFQLRNRYETEHELAELKEQQTMLISREYQTLQNAYSMNARLFHDFRNHLGAIRRLLQTGQSEEALHYIDDLAGPDTLSKTHWTGDDTIDYLIGSKAETAGSLQITFTAQVEFPRNAPIKSADLCSILGNLLDNAIEASQKVPNASDRYIALTIRRINHMLMIRVENRFENAPVMESGALRTSKTDGGLHGWGVKSARAAAEKYDGTLQTSFEGNVFRAVVTLSF